MDLSATYKIDAPRQAVWDRLIDPAVIMECLPGCDSFEPIGNDRYRVALTVRVAAIMGHYEGTVAIEDKEAPSSYRLVIDGAGRGGFAKGEAAITLTGTGDHTNVSVVAHARVGGTVARVGQRLLGSVSKMMMDGFFACLVRYVTAQAQGSDSSPATSHGNVDG